MSFSSAAVPVPDLAAAAAPESRQDLLVVGAEPFAAAGLGTASCVSDPWIPVS